MIVDYDPPLKKLSEEFVPHTRTLTHALLSLSTVYPRRNLSADQVILDSDLLTQNNANI